MFHLNIPLKIFLIVFSILTVIFIFSTTIELESFEKHLSNANVGYEHHGSNSSTTNTELYTNFTNQIFDLQEQHNQDIEMIQKLTAQVEDLTKSNTSLTKQAKEFAVEIEQLKQSLVQEEQEGNNLNENDSENKAQDNTNTSMVEEEKSLYEAHEVCSYLPSPSFSASQIWSQYLSRIFSASINPFKPALETDENKKITENLLMNELTAARFRRAIRHLPTFKHASVKNIFNIVERRFQDPQNNPPLRIAVFGGSVTIGRGCGENKRAQQDLKCAWPQRFELLVNQFFGKEIIKVYNLGIGGTTSDTASRIIEYWMYNDPALYRNGPDVIINSYSTNDSLPPWIGSSRVTMTTHDVIGLTSNTQMRVIQNFLRTALMSKRCDIQPLVLHVDDYLGPQQEQVLGELSYISVLTQLAKWYDTGVVSYPEVVRDLVYKNASDRTFFNKDDVHYGHFAHQTIAWSLGFSCIELLSNYCDDEYHRRSSISGYRNRTRNSLPHDPPNIEVHPPILPPRLTDSLLLRNVTEEFQAALDSSNSTELGSNSCSSISKENPVNPCEIAWISTPGGFGIQQIQNFMNRFSTNNTGWEVEVNGASGWSNKLGWATNKPNSSFALHFPNVGKDLNTLTVAYLKSYGERWEGSSSKFSGIKHDGSENKTVFVHEISGVHNLTASLTMIEQISFSETVRKGESLDVQVDLISGETFKILGLMLCAF